MKFNSQVCTTKEQSERLLALVLKKETADMAYEYKPKHLADTDPDKDWILVAHSPCGTDIPAWSLHRLIEMMPQGIQDCRYRSFALAVNSEGVSYEYHYIDEEGQGYNDLIGCTDLSDNLYDDIIAHIEWLIGEGYFNKEYLEE
ncbi:MAG: hypothetical protein IJN55_08080 [Alistipes sp.]|nr:hypothetical protein [Alistipes sp.]